MKRLVLILVGLMMFAHSVAAKSPLRDVIEVENAFLVIGQADSIRRNCATIVPRTIKVIFFVHSLEKRARDLGYSRDEIKIYTDSDADKTRLRAKAAALLASKGVETSDPQSYCAVGMTEIQKSSQIGSLLRAK
jgi:hypothetical protein